MITRPTLLKTNYVVLQELETVLKNLFMGFTENKTETDLGLLQHPRWSSTTKSSNLYVAAVLDRPCKMMAVNKSHFLNSVEDQKFKLMDLLTVKNSQKTFRSALWWSIKIWFSHWEVM